MLNVIIIPLRCIADGVPRRIVDNIFFRLCEPNTTLFSVVNLLLLLYKAGICGFCYEAGIWGILL